MTEISLVSPETVGLSATRLQRLDRWAERLVDSGKLPGVLTMVMRRGQLAHLSVYGKADVERGTPLRSDTIFRIYSMTKPLTSTAIMMLYEDGHFQLDDPITRFLPCFRNMRVLTGGARGKWDSVPAERDITFRDLLTHTAGFTNASMAATQVDALYRNANIDFTFGECSLGEMVERLSEMPLLAQPGAEWNYSVATDVLGHLVSVISGQPFDEFLEQRILRPLGMVDTGFEVPSSKLPRLAANYRPGDGGRLEVIDDPANSRYAKKPPIPSGGGGLVSTASDYMRFCHMMLRKGELDGVRLLGRKTVELMTSNHLRGDMGDMGQPRFSESTYQGIGFGLGFSVMLDPAKAQILGTQGEYAWGGVASTAFWIDPVEDMAVLLLTQLMPSWTYPIRREARVLTYMSIVD
jgi:CubicO group peptidase (beta-lactamase class C family)